MQNKVDANASIVDPNKIISQLASKIGILEANNAILKAQLEAKESGDKDGQQDTKS
jgi:hypothetical protein